MISFVMCSCCSAFRLLPTAVLLVFSLILRCLAVGSWYKPLCSIQWMVNTRPCLVLLLQSLRTYISTHSNSESKSRCLRKSFLPFWTQSTQQQKKEKMITSRIYRSTPVIYNHLRLYSGTRPLSSAAQDKLRDIMEDYRAKK